MARRPGRVKFAGALGLADLSLPMRLLQRAPAGLGYICGYGVYASKSGEPSVVDVPAADPIS